MKSKRDWPRNVMKNGAVELDIAGEVFKGHAKQIVDAKPLERVKALLANKLLGCVVGRVVRTGTEGAFVVTIGG